MNDTLNREREGVLSWWRAQGATFQAVVPGLYAWGVTVEPVSWSPRSGAAPKLLASAALVALAIGPAFERRAPDQVRLVSGWGFVLSSILVWVVAPEPAFAAFDARRGIAGMLGWALFAFASASPAREARIAATAGPPVRPRALDSRADVSMLFVGLAAAVALQLIGWRVADRDRMLLIRTVGIAGGLGLITAAGAAAIAGKAPADEDRVPRPRRSRLPARVVVVALLACILVGVGTVYELWPLH
jgi:hypothetical protein